MTAETAADYFAVEAIEEETPAENNADYFAVEAIEEETPAENNADYFAVEAIAEETPAEPTADYFAVEAIAEETPAETAADYFAVEAIEEETPAEPGAGYEVPRDPPVPGRPGQASLLLNVQQPIVTETSAYLSPLTKGGYRGVVERRDPEDVRLEFTPPTPPSQGGECVEDLVPPYSGLRTDGARSTPTRRASAWIGLGRAPSLARRVGGAAIAIVRFHLGNRPEITSRLGSPSRGAWGRGGLGPAKPPDGRPRLSGLGACPAGCDPRHPAHRETGKLFLAGFLLYGSRVRRYAHTNTRMAACLSGLDLAWASSLYGASGWWGGDRHRTVCHSWLLRVRKGMHALAFGFS